MVHLGCRWVHSGSLRSVVSALGVVGFIRGRSGSHWASLGSLWGSMSLSAVVGFTWVRAGGRWIHSGSLGWLWGSLSSSADVGFTRVHGGCRWFHLESWGSLGLPLGVVGFIKVRPGGSSVHLGSLSSLGLALGFLGFALGVVEFIRGRCVHFGSTWSSSGSFGVVGFTRIRPGGLLVHPRSLGTFGFALRPAGFNRHHGVHLVSP